MWCPYAREGRFLIARNSKSLFSTFKVHSCELHAIHLKRAGMIGQCHRYGTGSPNKTSAKFTVVKRITHNTYAASRRIKDMTIGPDENAPTAAFALRLRK